MTIETLARAEIRRLRPYEAAVQVSDTVRLNANEAPWTSGEGRYRRPLNRYPEIRPERLQHSLAQRYGCAADNLLVTRGSSEAIDLLIRVFCRAGQDNIVTTTPTFSMYRHYALIQGAQTREVPTEASEDFRVDVDRLLSMCDDNSRIIFLCSPNNPTGTQVPRSDVVRLLESRGPRSAVVLDEAYVEFSGTPSMVELTGQFDNLLVLRTLSKALAFAGVRCGAVIGPQAVIDMLNAVQAPYALATPVVECVEDALAGADAQRADSAIRDLVAERERVMAAVQELDCVMHVWPSAANFFLARVSDAIGLVGHTAQEGILLRHFDGTLADCVRVSVGSRTENELLLASLRRFESRPD